MANQTELLNVSDEMKLDDDRQNFCEELGAEELCSSSLDTFEELYSSSATDACGDGMLAVQTTRSKTSCECNESEYCLGKTEARNYRTEES